MCRSKQSGQEYAVKIVRSEDPEILVHSEREYLAMRRLAGHPNLLQAIDYIPERRRGRGYIVMERAHGQHILNLVMERGPIEEGLGRLIMKAVLSGISFMHG